MSQFTIIPCTEDRLEEWITLGHKAYYEYYRIVWEDDGSWYANKSFNAAVFETCQSEGGYIGFCQIDGQPVGVIVMRLQQELAVSQNQKGLLLDKLYLTRKAQGYGLGKWCMSWAENYARNHGESFIWLTAMDFSMAYTFYKKIGYQLVETIRLPYDNMKPEYRTLHFLKKEL